MKIRSALVVGIVIVAGILYVGDRANAQTQPASTPRGSNFDQRLEQRKRERQIVLEKRDRSRLESTCVAAQGKIRGVQQRTAGVIDNRNKVYLRIDAKLLVIIGRLRLADRNTFPLEKLRAQYSTDVGRFQSLAINYRQVLDDMTLVNCQADIVGFKALLDTARIYHKQLLSQSKVLNDLVVNAIKNDLATHAKEMQPAPVTEEGGQ